MFPSFFFLLNFFKFKVIVEEAILSEDNHVGAGDLLIKDVKWATKWVWLPRIGEGEQA